MIEIIRGNYKAARCSCSRLFKFQDEDVKHIVKTLSLFGNKTYEMIDFVECPSCRKRVFKRKGAWL